MDDVRTRLRLPAATAVTLLFFFGIGTAAATAPPPSTAVAYAESAQQKAASTRLVIRVRGCGGCTIRPVSAPKAPEAGEPDDVWQGRNRVVRKGKVVFRVPTKRTKGLYLEVQDPDAVNTGAIPLAVVRYPGHKPGTIVTAKQAAHAKRGFHCYRGTSRAKAQWKMRVDRYPEADVYTGDPGYAIRPYVSPGLRSMGNAHTLYYGTLGAQDWAYCNG